MGQTTGEDRGTQREAQRSAASPAPSGIQHNTHQCMPGRKLQELGKELAEKTKGNRTWCSPVVGNTARSHQPHGKTQNLWGMG